MMKINRGPAPLTIKVFAQKNVKALDGITKVTKADQELEKAIAFFTNPANFNNNVKITDQTFTFSVYKNSELVDALEAAFGPKCSYCESRFAHVTPKDIEHFRPKSEVETGNGKLQPGYFWLAGEWTNLLVSCPDCNRARNHQVPGQSAKVKLGKETQFPLMNEGFRLRNRGPLNDEEKVRLLLDPCNDQPEDHLTFDDNGLILARPDANGQKSAKGEASIMVFALQRKALVEERLRVLNDFKFCVSEMSYLIKNHNTLTTLNAPPADINANANQIRGIKDRLKEMFHVNAPYQAMLREYVRVGSQRGEFDNLVQFGINLLSLI